jgi:hypothetical protein
MPAVSHTTHEVAGWFRRCESRPGVPDLSGWRIGEQSPRAHVELVVEITREAGKFAGHASLTELRAETETWLGHHAR